MTHVYEPASLQSLALAVVMQGLDEDEAGGGEEDDALLRERKLKLYPHPIKNNIQALQALNGHYIVNSVLFDVKCSNNVSRLSLVDKWEMGEVGLGDNLDVSLNMQHDPNLFVCISNQWIGVETNFFENFEVEETLHPNEIKFKQSIMDCDSVKIFKWFAEKPSKNEKVKNWSYTETSLKLLDSSQDPSTLLWKKYIYLHKSCTKDLYDTTIFWECRALKVSDKSNVHDL